MCCQELGRADAVGLLSADFNYVAKVGVDPEVEYLSSEFDFFTGHDWRIALFLEVWNSAASHLGPGIDAFIERVIEISAEQHHVECSCVAVAELHVG